ncbi:MAG: hypothetical protein HYY35_06500 [Deltaproteobacteria bacterium]|nr:hypothetical protein [Deltaproteobacteria bacterium]
MRITGLALGAVTALLVAAGPASAQGAGGASSSAAKSSAAKHTGCLAAAAEPNEFKLTHVDGGSEEYALIGGTDLKGHVGHKVEVTGETLAASEAERAEKGAGRGEGGKAEAGHQQLRMSAMKHLAASCP